MNLTTEQDLAALVLGVPVRRAQKLRRAHRWPHVRLGRFDIRYTDAQIEQIVQIESVTPTQRVPKAKKATGQTARSASRGRKAEGRAAGLTERSAARSA